MAPRYERVRRIGWIVFEHLLFASALFLSIPPVPSNEGETYSFWPIAIPAGMLVGASRLIALRQGTETPLGAVLKVAIVLVAGFGMHARVNIH